MPNKNARPAPAAPKKPSSVPPLITEEADRALGRLLIRYSMISFSVAVLSMVACGIIYSRFPHNRLFAQNGPVFWLFAFLWLIPFYIGQSKQAALRIEFARKYMAEQRWKEAAAAVRSFDDFGQKSFDRTGEGHYLLAIAYDKLGRKDQAAKMREFVRRHRAGSDWAAKLSAANTAPPTLSQRRKSQETATGVNASTPETVVAAESAKRTGAGHSQSAQRARRRRF